jgi:putative transposase
VDERAIFAAVEEMREIERTATAATRSARRNRTRRAGLRLVASDSSEVSATQEAGIATADRPKPREVAAPGPARPFDVEEW